MLFERAEPMRIAFSTRLVMRSRELERDKDSIRLVKADSAYEGLNFGCVL